MTQIGNRSSVCVDALARLDVGLLPWPLVALALDFVTDGSSQDLVKSSSDCSYPEIPFDEVDKPNPVQDGRITLAR